MYYYTIQPQMTLSDRVAIEVGIERKESFKLIAKRLHRHPSTIAHEVKENRTFIHGNYPGGNDCKFARQCAVQHICGEDDYCDYRCRLCRTRNCHDYCKRYVSVRCNKWESAPYCNPMASWQKPHIEKNHEYIRYAIPKKKSLNPYSQEDMTLLMNHINSTKRPGLGNKSPYELLLEDENNEDFMLLWQLLKMDLIPPDEVHLMPDLFKFNL